MAVSYFVGLVCDLSYLSPAKIESEIMIRKLAKKIISKNDKKRFDTALLTDLVFVNMGAGITRIEGAINIDISPKADISVNLGVDPLPFDDESVDLIYSDHTIFRSLLRRYLFNIVRDIKFAVVKGDNPSALTMQIARNLPSAYRRISSLRKSY
tara:strand:- start:30 stop:491 length:462 start_codon:yes stop_codon:yes gene_type:complete